MVVWGSAVECGYACNGLECAMVVSALSICTGKGVMYLLCRGFLHSFGRAARAVLMVVCKGVLGRPSPSAEAEGVDVRGHACRQRISRLIVKQRSAPRRRCLEGKPKRVGFNGMSEPPGLARALEGMWEAMLRAGLMNGFDFFRASCSALARPPREGKL